MTAPTDRPKEAGDLKKVEGRNRFLVITVIVMAVALVGLGTWVIYDQATTGVDGEIQQVLDDYLAAWEARDEAAVRSVTTEDFVINEYLYHDDRIRGFGLSGIESGDIDDVVNLGFDTAWTNEHVGDPIVTGEGPWFVSVEENWEGTAAREEGQANYTIVEVDGVLKIANHYWAGLRSPLFP